MLKKLFQALRNPRPYKAPRYPLTVRCARCGESISTNIHLHNDLSQLDEPGPKDSAYFAHKVLVGNGRCFQRVDVRLYFDSSRKLVSSEVIGGELVSHG